MALWLDVWPYGIRLRLMHIPSLPQAAPPLRSAGHARPERTLVLLVLERVL